MSSNRNKKSVALDIATPEGQAEIRRLASHADILIENFKPGGLAKYGLDYATLSNEFPEPRLLFDLRLRADRPKLHRNPAMI